MNILLNEKFAKINLIDYVFNQIFMMLYKEEFNDKFINFIEKIIQYKKEIYVRSICLMHNRLRSLCILFSNWKINYLYYHAIFYVLLHYVYRIRRGIK